MLLFAPIASGFRRVFRLTFHSVLSLFSPRGPCIQILVVCLLSVTVFTRAMEQVPDGSMTVHSADPVPFKPHIYLGEHHSEQGEHRVLLYFSGQEYLPRQSGAVDPNQYKWTYLGAAHFKDATTALQALNQAEEYANTESRRDQSSDSQSGWRYPLDILLCLRRSLDPETTRRWLAELPRPLAQWIDGKAELPLPLRTLTKGQDIRVLQCFSDKREERMVEEGYLWIDILLISSDRVRVVPSTPPVRVPLNRHCRIHSIGKIQNDIDIDQLRIHAKPEEREFRSWPEIQKTMLDVAKWKNAEDAWGEADEAAEAHADAANAPSGSRHYAKSALQEYKSIDGSLYNLFKNGAMTDDEMYHWVTELRPDCVDRLVRKIDAIVSKRNKRVAHPPTSN
ncbi:hypothetical protein FB446DRAFT_63105 [Lentinula raphanica]|nr:hypothetical protein FB446DRAFT_63105 [Lentinula raphanica]